MRKVQSKQEVHEAIIDAAERLLDRYGYGKMTMNDLAEEAGIGVGTTYLHFAGKADVALAVVTRFAQRHLQQLRDIAQADEPAAARLERMLTGRVLLRFETALVQQHPMDEFVQAIKAVIGARCIPWKDEETRLFAQVLEEGCAHGEFVCEAVEPTVEALLSATYGLLPHNLGPQDFADPDGVRRRAAQIACLLVRGLRAPSELPNPQRLETLPS